MFLRVLVPMIHQVQHGVVGERTVPGNGAALGIDGILGVGELVQEVKGFDAGDELALEEGLRKGGIEHEVIGIEFAATVASSTVHRSIHGKRGLQFGDGVVTIQTILIVKCIESLKVHHLALAVTPADPTRGTEVQHILIILDMRLFAQGQGIDGIEVTFCLVRKHSVVEAMMQRGVGIALHRPTVLLVQVARVVEAVAPGIATMDIDRLVGIDTRGRVVTETLPYVTMAVVESCVETYLLLVWSVMIGIGK